MNSTLALAHLTLVDLSPIVSTAVLAFLAGVVLGLALRVPERLKLIRGDEDSSNL